MACASATGRPTAKPSESAVDVAVIGGGVVGLAVAAALADPRRSLALFERHDGWGREITSRNSEVIHAGLYYPRGSLKATLCVEGRERLYARCRRESIPHKALGKLVVACDDEEVQRLEALCARGLANGAGALELLDAAALRAREPAVRGTAALWSPESGIVDALALCRSLAAEAEEKGAMLALRHTLVEVSDSGGSGTPTLTVRDPNGDRVEVHAARVVNAAGLEADHLAARCGIDLDAEQLRHHLCKGDYFSLAPNAPVSLSHLVYPLPAGAGLGIHATLDLGGRIRFGPDTEYIATPNFRVDAQKASLFARAIARYLPGLRSEDLLPDYAGVRPKRSGPGDPFRDFGVVEGTGSPGWIHLLGIESPGLTAALALAELVARRIR